MLSQVRGRERAGYRRSLSHTGVGCPDVGAVGSEKWMPPSYEDAGTLGSRELLRYTPDKAPKTRAQDVLE
jgi:hypothetical protein